MATYSVKMTDFSAKKLAQQIVISTLFIVLSGFASAREAVELFDINNAAEYDLNNPLREKQRAHFLRLENQIWKLSSQELADELKILGDYPLAPYLVAAKLNHRPSLSDVDAVREFLTRYEGTPLDHLVRKEWLEYLQRRNRFTLFREFFRPVKDTELYCEFLWQEYRAKGASKRLWEQTQEVWNVGRSQPSECDPIFKAWKDAGQLLEDIILQRIEKAVKANKTRLADYLTGLLPQRLQYLGRLWKQARQNPKRASRDINFTGNFQLIEADVASYIIERLIWSDIDAAINIFQRLSQRVVFSQQQLEENVNSIAISLALNDDQRAEKWLLKATEIGPNNDVTRWHLAYLLRQQDWQKIILLLNHTDPRLVNSEEFQYWLARAFEQTGQPEESQNLYQQLSQQRHYYGFLASARLNKPISFQHSPITVSAAEIQSILLNPQAQRAYEFLKLGRHYRARLEWNDLKSDMSNQQKLASSLISYHWQWYDQAIRTLGSLGELNDVRVRFPLAFIDVMRDEASKQKIEPQWSLAIARRESSFMVDAISSANARGLMQILPSTARYLEKRRVTSRDLLKPELNARVGHKYLRYLLDKMDNDVLLATASYNAGWSKVADWLPEDGAIDKDIWVELIPYKETRNYVKAVLSYHQIYQQKMLVNETGSNPFQALVSEQIVAE